MGSVAAHDVRVTVTTAPGLKVVDGSEFSISRLDAGEGRKFELEVAAESVGFSEVSARAAYKDAMGNEYSQEVEKQVEIYEEVEEEKEVSEEVPGFKLLSVMAAALIAFLIRRLQQSARR